MKTFALGTLLAAALVTAPSVASAKASAGSVGANDGATTLRAPDRLVYQHQLADSVVVQPQGNPAPAAPAAPTTVVAPAAPAAPVVAQPVVAEPSGPRKVVHTEVQQNHNYMTTIAVSALMGGLAGGLVGGAIYYLGDRRDAINIAYWGAGGVLLGTGVGIMQLMVQEGRASEATALRKLPSDPAPTMRLALFHTSF